VPKVVITMPAYRAERTLAQTVADIPTGVADLLILVDDASPDNTAQLARDLGIDVYVHSQNLGYGGNQKTCYTEALRSGADIVVLLHPDYQYEPKAVPLLIAPILAGDADMTFGSRFAGLGDPIGGGMPVYRYIGNRVTTILENVMLGSRFSELHSGLRAYTRRFLLSLPFLRYSDDFVFDSQILIDAVTSGLRVVEVPIPTRYTKESSSIAIGRSLAYILGSLGYCARRFATRGRRGRRSSVANPAAFSRGAHMGASASARANVGEDVDLMSAAELVLDAAEGYVVPQDRLLAIGPQGDYVAERARLRGWEVPGPAGINEAAESPQSKRGARPRRVVVGHGSPEKIDAIVLLHPGGPLTDTLDDLRQARASLEPEGLALVGVSDAGTVRAAVDQTGLRPVEWISVTPLAGVGLRSRFGRRSLGAAVARPTENAPRTA
jgi:hypothetical protein